MRELQEEIARLQAEAQAAAEAAAEAQAAEATLAAALPSHVQEELGTEPHRWARTHVYPRHISK